MRNYTTVREEFACEILKKPSAQWIVYAWAFESQPRGFFLVPLRSFQIAQGAARNSAIVERLSKIRPEGKSMAALDWSQCDAVERVPGKRGGAWDFRGMRTPGSTVFENLQDMSVDELVEDFGVTREQVQAVLQFAALSTKSGACSSQTLDR